MESAYVLTHRYPIPVAKDDAMRIKLRKQLFIIILITGTCFGWTCGPANPPENPNCAALTVFCMEDLSEVPVEELP